jgi:hypothetical protein
MSKIILTFIIYTRQGISKGLIPLHGVRRVDSVVQLRQLVARLQPAFYFTLNHNHQIYFII